MKIMITGSEGFICGYLVENLLSNGHSVVGIDNFSKYGEVRRSYANHPNYTFINGDVCDTELLKKHLQDCDHLVASAAKIGGISYFHEYAYDLMAENERIMASTFDAAIHAFKNNKLQKITVLSSSMVYENTNKYPTPEGDQLLSPPPFSTYGFQKLAAEYFAKGAWEQYKLPYTIARPFNCIGIGEGRALGDVEIKSGNVKLAMSHVVPDIIQKIIKGQNPLHILGDGQQIRHYTYGGDLAEGIRLCIEHPKALNNDFNLSTATATSVIELAEIIWNKINPNEEFHYVCDDPFTHDVQKRSPEVKKAKRVLGFEALTTLEDALDEIIPWVSDQVKKGLI